MNEPMLTLAEECSISRQITSCHVCCRTTSVDETPNVIGKIHRAKFETLCGVGCRKCSTHVKSQEEDDFKEVLDSIDSTT